MSDTPIADSTSHNVAELGMLCRKLERELNASNDRIKRLEEGGDKAILNSYLPDRLAVWNEAKEDKL
jgi:hypothetical protein